SLLELIEHSRTTSYERRAIDRGCDTLRAAIEQPHTEDRLESADCLRHGRLSDAQMRRRLGHAARLHHGKKHMQIAQPQTATDQAHPIDGLGHEGEVISIYGNWVFGLYRGRPSVATEPPMKTGRE